MKAVSRSTAAILMMLSLAVPGTFMQVLSAQEKVKERPQETPAKPELGPATKPTTLETDSARTAAASQITGGTVTAAPVDPRSYIIGPEDILYISVWREPDFTRAVQVRPDGKFTLPLLGDIVAAGLTPDKLSADVAEALGKIINKPEVTVSVQSVQSKKFYITGEVGRTGSFPLVVPITVLEALTNAGGFHEYAKKNKIIIMRGTERIKFNYNEVIKGKNLKQNILVEPGDYIFVP